MQINKPTAWLLFLVYLIALTKFILFKYPARFIQGLWHVGQNGIEKGIQKMSLVPFRTFIICYRKGNLEYALTNLGGNFVGFFPLGFFAFYLFKCKNAWWAFCFGFLISLGFETLQLIAGIGFFEFDDLMLNSLGTWIGYIISKKWMH
jgi:glycopeptide antibiotics resistance protein